MKNLFQRIKHKKFVYTQPFQHIVYRNLINLEEFDRLYENMHYFNGARWTEWKKEYGLDCEVLEDVSKISYGMYMLEIIYKNKTINKIIIKQ